MRKNRSQKKTLCEPRGISQSVHSLSRVWLFATPRTAACQASLSMTNSHSAPRPMSTESVMPLNHLILCRPLLLLPSIFPSIRVFSSESALCIRWFLRVQNLGVRQHCFHRHVLTGVFNLLEAWKESESISHSVVSDSATPWTVAHQAPPSMGSSRQECWSGLPFPSPGDLPNPGMLPRSPVVQAGRLPSQPPGKLLKAYTSLRAYSTYWAVHALRNHKKTTSFM